MTYNIDFSLATSDQIEAALCARLESIRLSRNTTQKQLAKEAGVSLRTIGRLENGEGVSLDTFIRVVIALRIQHHLESMLPDPSVRPIERVGIGRRQRRRARPSSSGGGGATWAWGDGADGDER